MKVKQLIAILLMLLLLTACSANTDLDRPDEVGPSEQTFNMDASAAEPEDGGGKTDAARDRDARGSPGRRTGGDAACHCGRQHQRRKYG